MRGSKPGERRGGRKKGSTNRITQASEERLALALKGRRAPLEYLLDVLNEPDLTPLEDEEPAVFLSRCNAQIARRMEAAKAAVPYTNPRLQAIEHKQDDKQFKEEQAAKAANMDIMEVARRMAFIFAEAKRTKAQTEPPKAEQPETRVH